ncbi:hypothetical protein WICPIJ_009720 [Wickerhamomyces pijperi]|uniref:Secreted protein n=1 Tax=Wickerhamomyces pijperi TaxID=599730 RepID=A0A9P8PJU4_WICPI|nr:hypothetical protein WICPIJ_009720 [Wickerhamomyces pijperi]
MSLFFSFLATASAKISPILAFNLSNCSSFNSDSISISPSSELVDLFKSSVSLIKLEITVAINLSLSSEFKFGFTR